MSPADLSAREPWLSEPEHMDRPDAGGEDLDRALVELGRVHDWLGGARCARIGLRRLLAGRPAAAPLTVLDVGSGGGEMAAETRRWRRGDGARRTLLLDFNRGACLRSRHRCKGQDVVLQSDGFRVPLREGSVDVVHCGLFLHHFGAADAAELLRRLLPLCRVGLLVSDLHRHRLPHAVTGLGARWLSRSAMVRHDAPLSVARGFRRHELEAVAAAAGFAWTEVRRVWPWRWLALKQIEP